jgi:NADPH-dependent 2,4-dienoyl-CoA reductase/sulfur reductase-like enzyme
MSENEKKLEVNINRRSFLKGIAATGEMAITATQTVDAVQAPAAQGSSAVITATKSWKDKPEPIDEGLISDSGTYDIVVVGGGIAGTLCARVATMKGASVAVIENHFNRTNRIFRIIVFTLYRNFKYRILEVPQKYKLRLARVVYACTGSLRKC